MPNARKRTSLLEKIRDGRTEGHDRMKLPTWWQDHPEGRAPASEAGEPDDPARRRPQNWLWRSRRFQLAPGLLLVLGVVLLAMLVTAYELGRRSAFAELAGGSPGADRTPADSDAIQNQPINAALMRRDGGGSRNGGTDTRARQPDAASDAGGTTANGANRSPQAPVHDATGSSPGFFVSGSAEDPRRRGYNYFCVATLPSQYKSEAERAVKFLEANDVDAAAISVDNWIQIVALRGFESPTSPQARQMESLLRGLGRIWKAEHRGGRDWSDLYPMKYTGD